MHTEDRSIGLYADSDEMYEVLSREMRLRSFWSMSFSMHVLSRPEYYRGRKQGDSHNVRKKTYSWRHSLSEVSVKTFICDRGDVVPLGV